MERYTDAEWAAIIDQTARELIVPDASHKYPCPPVGSVDFMKTIDHTLLKLEAKSTQFDDLCAEARVDNFATVCVRPPYVQRCLTNLKSTTVHIASVIGFHEGTHPLSHKLQELHQSLSAGAHELDAVINYPQLQRGEYASIYRELATLRAAAPPPTTLLKLILETSQLTREQIVAGCVLAGAAGWDFVKTSTGFNGPGASVENVRIMRACCERLAGDAGITGGRMMRVKASGGIRTLADAVMMLEAGASRLGTSAGVWIAKEAKESANGVEVNGSAGERPGLATRLFTDY